jgi:DNA integrity scanning protein DisA with diadenylate cyclase activity
MDTKKEKNLLDYLKKISPGSLIRIALDDILNSNLGALIVIETPELYSKNLFEGGFKINTKLTSQK